LCGELSGGTCRGGCLAGLCVPRWSRILPRPSASPPPRLLAFAPCAGLLVGALPATCGPVGELLWGCAWCPADIGDIFLVIATFFSCATKVLHPMCGEVLYLRIAQVLLMVSYFFCRLSCSESAALVRGEAPLPPHGTVISSINLLFNNNINRAMLSGMSSINLPLVVAGQISFLLLLALLRPSFLIDFCH
jgi:hypothetical protein